MSKGAHDAEEGTGSLGGVVTDGVNGWAWALRPEFRASGKSAHALLSQFLDLNYIPSEDFILSPRG